MAGMTLGSTTGLKVKALLEKSYPVPLTIPQLVEQLAVSANGVRRALNILIGTDAAMETKAVKHNGRTLKGYIAVRKQSTILPTRGDYIPPPLPLRYEPRETTLVTLRDSKRS